MRRYSCMNPLPVVEFVKTSLKPKASKIHLNIYTQTHLFQIHTALPSHTQTHTADYGLANRDRLCLNNQSLQEFFQGTKMAVFGSRLQPQVQ